MTIPDLSCDLWQPHSFRVPPLIPTHLHTIYTVSTHILSPSRHTRPLLSSQIPSKNWERVGWCSRVRGTHTHAHTPLTQTCSTDLQVIKLCAFQSVSFAALAADSCAFLHHHSNTILSLSALNIRQNHTRSEEAT